MRKNAQPRCCSIDDRILSTRTTRGFATRSARSIARANDSWPTFFIFFYFFLTSPTFSSIRFRSRRRPPPPRCRRFFGSALLETFDLEPLFLTPFIELTGISPCFCITLRRWKTDSVVSRRSNTYTYTQKRSASSERVTPPKIFQKAYRAFRIPLSFAFLPFSRCSFPGITFIQFRFKVIHTRDN